MTMLVARTSPSSFAISVAGTRSTCWAGAFASASTMLECMNHLASLGLLGLEELEAVGFHNPLRIIGLGPHAVRAGPALAWDAAGRRFHLG